MSATCGVPLGGKAALTALLACLLALSACGSKRQQETAASGASAGQTGTTEPETAPGAEPAPAVTEASWSPDTLENLVAPIALYPDALVGQILTASVNSQEVLDAGNWLLQNQNLQGEALDSAAQKAGLGPATRALIQFPQVVDMMCQEIDWTRQLGAAFTSDQQGVLDAVQTLRAQAQHVGNLQSTPQQKVTTKTDNNKTVIEVQPANPQVIYVPQYNPQVVYTTPPPSPPPATVAPASTEGTVSTGAAVAGGLVAFGVGMLIGSAINNDCCYPHWGAGAVYVGPRPFYPPAYVYRPVYGPAFRPAYGYVSPPAYRYNYANVNRNVNVNVNNNYFNQFNHNQNLRTNTQNNLSGATRNPDWKGQSSYAGARASPAQQARFNEAMGRPASTELSGASPRVNAGSSQGRMGGAGSTRNPELASNRASAAGGNRPGSAEPAARPGADRGYGAPNRSGDSGLGANRNPAGANRQSTGLGANSSAGASGANRGAAGAGANTNSAGFGANREATGGGASVGQHDQAFSGASEAGGGGFARAASARGNASAGGLAARGGGGRRR
jgi:hypothetical protein